MTDVAAFTKVPALMRFSLQGRVRNLPLSPQRKPLQPLFEAVINSIQAIQEANVKNGYVQISAQREDVAQASLLPDQGESGPFKSFTIEDNGIGFDANNFGSFETSDSTYKASKGAKGVGRLFWLKAFDRVEVRSIFNEDGTLYERSFDFVEKGEGVTNEKLEQSRSGRRFTRVRLIGYKPEYQQYCPKSIRTIADKLLEHCLMFLLADNCPKIIITDNEETFNLNDLLAAHDYKKERFVVKDEQFSIVHLKRYSSIERLNKMLFCANDRTVYSKDISKKIPDLGTNLIDESSRPFKYAAMIQGNYLNEHVSPDRTRFDLADRIEENDSLYEDSELSREEIENAAVIKVREFLGDHLQSISNDKLERIRRHIENVTPQFKPLLTHKLDKLLELRPDLSAADLTAALHRIYSELQGELKDRTKRVLTGEITDEEKYQEEYARLVHELSEVSMSELAQHVLHRKLILDLLENILKRKDGKYRREQIVHKLIFPMRTTSEKVFEEDQNLWIVDEKLSYHRFLASDMELASMSEAVSTDSRKRPDIIIFNRIVLAEDDDPHDSVVILEFKKPMRMNYDEEENPIDQAYGYIDDIRAGKAEDAEGRPLRAKPHARFFVYILCDVTAKIKEYARKASFKAAADEDGFFHYNENYQAYIEIIPFTKLLNDAKKRNRILFDKLNLPYT